MRNFWQFNSLGEIEAELLLYGDISSSVPWWSDGTDGVFASQFIADLKALGAVNKLTVRVNSRGGDVSAATAIFTQLKAHDAAVTVIVDGMAASAATIIMMAGDVIKAPAAAQVMVHDPLLMLYGMYNAEDMDKMKAVLETSKNSIMNAYMTKTGRTRDELSQLMSAETWMTAEEAKAQGFVDEIMFEQQVEASVTNDNRYVVMNSVAHDMSKFSARPNVSVPNKPAAAAPAAPHIPAIPDPVAVNKPKGSVEEVEIKNIEDFKKLLPDLYNQVVTEATNAERTRLQGIEEIASNISDELVAEAKFTKPVTAAELALNAMKADAGKGLKFIENRATELAPNNAIPAGTPLTTDEQEKANTAASIDYIAAAANAGRETGAK